MDLFFAEKFGFVAHFFAVVKGDIFVFFWQTIRWADNSVWLSFRVWVPIRGRGGGSRPKEDFLKGLTT